MAPTLSLTKPTHILFHPNEQQRRNSSGRLLKNCIGIKSTQWHRLNNEQLEEKFNGYALLYPKNDNETLDNDVPAQQAKNADNLDLDAYPVDSRSDPIGYLWIDATWQESRKMLRQSPWLKKLSKYSISAHLDATLPKSQYTLRRNQTNEGLSTIETFAYWLHEQNQPKDAQDLLNFFNQFQSAFLAARNSGLFK